MIKVKDNKDMEIKDNNTMATIKISIQDKDNNMVDIKGKINNRDNKINIMDKMKDIQINNMEETDKVNLEEMITIIKDKIINTILIKGAFMVANKEDMETNNIQIIKDNKDIKVSNKTYINKDNKIMDKISIKAKVNKDMKDRHIIEKHS